MGNRKQKKSIINMIMSYVALYGIWLMGMITSVRGAYLFLGYYGLGAGVFLEIVEIVIISVLVFQLAKRILPIGVIVFLVTIAVVLTGISCWDQSIFVNDFFSKKISGVMERRAEINAIQEKIVGIKADIALRSLPYKDLHNTVVGAREKALAKVGVPDLNKKIEAENEKIFKIRIVLNKLEADNKLEVFMCDSIWPGLAIVLLVKLSQLSIIFIVSFNGIFDIPEKKEEDHEHHNQDDKYSYRHDQNRRPEPQRIHEDEWYQEKHHAEEEAHQEQYHQEQRPVEATEETELYESDAEDIAVNDIPSPPPQRVMRSIPGGLLNSKNSVGQQKPAPSELTEHQKELTRLVVKSIADEKEYSVSQLAKALGRSKEYAEDFLKGKVEISKVPFDNFRKATYGPGRKNNELFNQFVLLKEQEL